MGTVKRRWIESMEPTEEPPIERERLQCGDPGYTDGISAGADSKPTLTDEERAALHWFAHYGLPEHRAATLRGLLERMK
jgi:hypothetical protein